MAQNNDWGNGILMSQREYEIAMTLNKEFGLRELQAKVNARVGIDDDLAPNRFSIDAQFCYGTNTAEIVRKYLDSGVLQKYLEKNFYNDNRCWDGSDAYRFTVLGACVMSLGCTLPGDMKSRLERMQDPAYWKTIKMRHPKSELATMKPLAKFQLKTAIKSYQDGQPYSYGNLSQNEVLLPIRSGGKLVRSRTVGCVQIIETMGPNRMVLPHFVGAPSDEEIGLKPTHPYHTCGGCGAKEGAGPKFSVCGGCKDRKYCSKECQKKHWKQHKVVCTTLSREAMEHFIENIPEVLTEDDKKNPFD